jgi:hypothetical protein
MIHEPTGLDQELLPCPFCGKEMEVRSAGRDWYDICAVPEHEAACMIGEALFRVPQVDSDLQYLIDDWNTRASKPLPVEAIEVALVYLGDKLIESDGAKTRAASTMRQLWEDNSAALRRHISALSALIEGAKQQ